MSDRLLHGPGNPDQPTARVQHEFKETFFIGNDNEGLRNRNTIVDTDPTHLLVIRKAGEKMVEREGYTYVGNYTTGLQFYTTLPFERTDVLKFNEYDDPRYVVQDPPSLTPHTPTSVDINRPNFSIFIGFMRPIPMTEGEKLVTNYCTQLILNQKLGHTMITYGTNGEIRHAEAGFALKSPAEQPIRFICGFREEDFEKAKGGTAVTKTQDYSKAHLTYDPEKKGYTISNEQSDEYSIPSNLFIPESIDAEKLSADIVPEELRTNPLIPKGEKDTWRNLNMEKLQELTGISWH